MTHQDDIRVQVTRYLDDITVRGPRYAIRETGLSNPLFTNTVGVCMYISNDSNNSRRSNSTRSGSVCSNSDRETMVVFVVMVIERRR